MSGFIAWIILGLVAGSLAKFLMPGDQKGGCLMTIVLGVIGAVVGGWLGQYATFLPNEPIGTWLPSLGSILTATAGAFVLLLLMRLVTRK